MNDLLKEKNFISAVVYLHNDEDSVMNFFINLNEMLDSHFENYEFVIVDDACTDDLIMILRNWASSIDKPITILHMSLYHGREEAMNAGLDAAIGDYVYEFDSTQIPYEMELVYKAYQNAIDGSDIICVCPKHLRGISSLFYMVFNANSNTSYKLQTDAFRLLTRRAINRVHEFNSYMPYRKAAYAASGLEIRSIIFEGQVFNHQRAKISLAIDSLALYTDAGYRLSIGITVFMMLVAFIELVYTIVIYCIGKPIEGWTTLMLVMTFGFLGLYFILCIVIKFLSLNLDMTFRKQKYLIESIEKIQK